MKSEKQKWIERKINAMNEWMKRKKHIKLHGDPFQWTYFDIIKQNR